MVRRWSGINIYGGGITDLNLFVLMNMSIILLIESLKVWTFVSAALLKVVILEPTE